MIKTLPLETVTFSLDDAASLVGIHFSLDAASVWVNYLMMLNRGLISSIRVRSDACDLNICLAKKSNPADRPLNTP